VLALLRRRAVSDAAAQLCPAACSPAVAGANDVIGFCYTGIPESVGAARRDMADALDGCPVMDDALWLLSEIATNAVLHFRSSGPGGIFLVDLAVRTSQFVTISVTDQGALDEVPDDCHSREKLAIGLADRFWMDVGDRGRTISVFLDWPQA
jgi:hypothetical protein